MSLIDPHHSMTQERVSSVLHQQNKAQKSLQGSGNPGECDVTQAGEEDSDKRQGEGDQGRLDLTTGNLLKTLTRTIQ